MLSNEVWIDGESIYPAFCINYTKYIRKICAKSKLSENLIKIVDSVVLLCYTVAKIRNTEGSTMNRMEQEKKSAELLRYGTYVEDVETKEANGYKRVRVIEYKGKRYFHKMFNGELIELAELKRV